MFEIRRYEAADHDAVFELHNVALEAVGAHVGNGPWDEDLHDVQTVYLDAGGEFLVGELDGQIVAMGALKKTGDGCAEVTRMRIDPEHQRRGFGQAILTRLERRAVELGLLHLHLHTTVQQVAAQKLYEKNGYAQTGRTRFAGFDVLIYEKTLDV